jgi:putative FmdB family regulatory protein
MPIYEYYCGNCDRQFEALKPISAASEPAACPDCGGKAERLMPTTFAARMRNQGALQRVPFHHKPIRNVEGKGKAPKAKGKSAGKGKRTKVVKK